MLGVRLCLLGVLLVPTIVTPGVAGDIMRGRCHMHYCTWFSIEEKKTVERNEHGELVQAILKFWQSYHRNGSYGVRAPRKGGDTATTYALCSKSKPALIGRDGPTWTATPLSPDRADGIFGATETAHAIYFSVCHGVAVADVYEAGVQLAGRLGYATDPNRHGVIELRRPEDIIRR